MSDLRKAAEEVLEAWNWDWSEQRNKMLRERIEALRQALAQPEREYTDVVVAEHADGTYTIQRIPPPKREWVGLTDEEIAKVEDEYIVDYRIPAGCAWNFARAIEAKLKEKNT